MPYLCSAHRPAPSQHPPSTLPPIPAPPSAPSPSFSYKQPGREPRAEPWHCWGRQKTGRVVFSCGSGNLKSECSRVLEQRRGVNTVLTSLQLLEVKTRGL